MRNNAIFLLVVLFTFLSTIKAQDVTDFKLSDYKYRTTGFRAMAGSASSNGNFNASSNKNDTGKITAGAHQFNLSAQLIQRQTYNLDARAHTVDIVTSLGTQLQGQNSGGFKNNNNVINLGGSYISSDILYREKYFLEIGGSASVAATITQNKMNTSKTATTSISPLLSLSLGIGQGRLENVMDAQMALFLLDDLYKKNIIRNKVDKQTAYQLAQLVTSLRNRRIFDYRVRRTVELSAIDSFFKAKKLVTASDINYFSSINDIWSFSIQAGNRQITQGYTGLNNVFINEFTIPGFINQLIRRSGTIRYIRLMPSFTPTIQSTKTDSTKFKTNSATTDIRLAVGMDKNIPVNLHWQKNYSVQVHSYYTPRSFNTSPTSSVPIIPGVPVVPEGSAAKTPLLEVGIDARYGVGYYPNTRTAIYWQVYGEVGYGLTKGFLGKGLSSSLGSNLNASYFINYNTRLAAEAQLIILPYGTGNYGKGSSGTFIYNISYYHSFY